MIAQGFSFPAPPQRLLRSLLAGDAVLIGVFLLFATLVATGARGGIPWILNIERADSLPSLWNYAKWGIAAVALSLAYRRLRQPVLAALAVVFAVILIDDAAEVHERINAFLVATLGVADGPTMRAGDLVGLATFAAMGLGATVLVGWGYIASDRGARRAARVIVGLFVLLALCGVVMDAVHGVLQWGLAGGAQAPLAFAAALLEDGGEMVVGSLLAGYAVRVAVVAGRLGLST